MPDPTPSAVITREPSVPENLSSGVETYVPRRLLYGLLPETLLERWGRCRGDVGEIQGRYGGDVGEIQGRCRGDAGEMQRRLLPETLLER